jgi:hypothetical protein
MRPSPYPNWVGPDARRDKYPNDFEVAQASRVQQPAPGHERWTLNHSQKWVFLMVSKSKDDDTASNLIRTVSRHSLAYILCAASEVFRHYDFDPLDLLIIHAIMNANVLNVMKNPELDRRFGSVKAVEPDEIKQGVSRAALSRFFGLPIETVRRRADRLKKEGILRETDQGLIVTEANQFKFGNNHELQKTNILLVRKFLRDLTEAGIELPGSV